MNIRTTEENTFTCIVADISGSGVSGYASNLQTECFIEGVSVPTTVVEVTGGLFSGLYEVSLTPSAGNTGSGYLSLAPALIDTTYDVSPDIFNFTVNDQDSDSVYNLVRVNAATAQEINTPANYDRIITTVKELDEFRDEFVISATNMRQDTDDLTGWTSFAFTAHDTTSLTTSADSSIFSGDSVTVTGTTDPATIEVVVNQIPAGLIPEGDSTRIIYADLKGVNPSGNTVTLKNFQMTITRNFN